MGCAGGKPSDPQNKMVEKELKKDHIKASEIKKLLLLGSGGSGKSTIFKQLQTIHADGFSDRDRRQFKSQIHEQMIEAMKTMLFKCEDFIEDYEDQGNNDEAAKFEINADCEDAKQTILRARNNAEMKEELINALTALWNDEAIKYAFSMRNQICVPDSTEHFLNGLDRVTHPDYVPNDEDLLLVRYRTTGMAEKHLEINEDGQTNQFLVCDVGGQRNERRKWIHFFDNVTAVIFVTALSMYDEVTFEDEDKNSMIDSIELFDEQVNSNHFKKTAFILFLNKSDLFREKIGNVPLTVCWKDYRGAQDFDEGVDFIRGKFEACNHEEERHIYTHVTCATDKDNVKRVFHDVQHVVINWSLERSGLL